MKIYFGLVDEQAADLFGTDELFSYDDKYYYYELNYATNSGDIEEIVIKDTCNRYLPFAVKNLDILIDALETVRDKQQIIQAGLDAQKEIL